MPCRDFVSLQPPLSFYNVAGGFKILETSLTPLRTLGLALYLLIGFLSLPLLRMFVRSAIAFVAALPGLVLGMPLFNFVPFAVWQGIAAVLAAAFCYLLAIRLRAFAFGLVAGALTGAAFALRQDQALYFCVALIIFSAVPWKTEPTERLILKRSFIAWTAGLLLFSAAALMIWWRGGALPAMTRQLVVFPVTTYARTSSLPFPVVPPGAPWWLDLLIGLFYLPPIVVTGTAVFLIWRFCQHRFGSNEAIILFLGTWSALFYCQAVARSDAQHLFITLPPFIFLVACFFSRALNHYFPKSAGRGRSLFLRAVSSRPWLLPP